MKNKFKIGDRVLLLPKKEIVTIVEVDHRKYYNSYSGKYEFAKIPYRIKTKTCRVWCKEKYLKKPLPFKRIIKGILKNE